ncbi:MAG TPA: cation:dicarboxylase symporter family transporter, partial [Thermomonas sp.]|nr:cation:dicarboxylase symporter family transporter [Thermomonas sp.]
MADAARGKLQLHWKMLIGFVAGLGLGLVAHYVSGADAGWVQWLTTYVTQPAGTLFLRLIFMLVIPLLFSALVIGVAEMGDVRALGRVGWKTLGYTVLASGIAVVLGLALVNWLHPGGGVDPAAAQAMLAQGADRAKAIVGSTGAQPQGLDMLLGIVPDNVIKAAAENTILAVMFFALMLGIGLVLTRSESTGVLLRGIEGLFEVSMTLIGLVIRLAPYAVFCFMFNLAALFGWDLLRSLGAYVGVVVLALAIHMFVVYSLMLKFLGGIGTAGVPAGSLPVVALICGMVGVPPEGIGLILGVDRLLDMCRTTL